MAEIKTCEQYVLAKLYETEEVNESFKDNLDALEKDYAELQHKLEIVRTLLTKYAEINSFESSHNEGERNYYIHFKDIDGWKKSDKEDYDTLVEMFNLKEDNDASSSN